MDVNGYWQAGGLYRCSCINPLAPTVVQVHPRRQLPHADAVGAAQRAVGLPEGALGGRSLLARLGVGAAAVLLRSGEWKGRVRTGVGCAGGAQTTRRVYDACR